MLKTTDAKLLSALALATSFSIPGYCQAVKHSIFDNEPMMSVRLITVFIYDQYLSYLSFKIDYLVPFLIQLISSLFPILFPF